MEPNLFRYIWRHSRREQLFILALIVLSLPFYWASLDVPKRIVNEALQGKAFAGGNTTATLFAFTIELPSWLGGGRFVLSEGYAFEQLGFLLALSLLFLFFVVCNNGFKLAINLSKGILAERMLRRMRFDLFARLMRFRPEDIRAVKPAEAASMINNEVEPVGGFIGDAFIQPAFLGTQALTALIFILVQSPWLGLVALVVVLAQAIIIPYLRREQVRLGRQRQIASRKLAGRIGEMVDGAQLVHAHGLQRYSLAEIGDRLGTLFDIRARLYKRKFSVKFLNNFLAQITPFFFYAVGGYLALRGRLDIGQLVAVIAAYRDLPPPIKELIDWDQARADATVKYEQVVLQLSSQPLMRSDDDGEARIGDGVALDIVLDAVRVDDHRGAPFLQELSGRIDAGSHVALIGSSSSGRDMLARVIARQITRYSGTARIGEVDLARMTGAEASRLIGYMPPDPVLFAGTLRDNIAIALRRRLPPDGPAAELKWREAQRSGNPSYPFATDWHDYAAAGLSGPDQLTAHIVKALSIGGMSDDLYELGLEGRLPEDAEPELRERIVVARRDLRQRLVAAGLDRMIQPFDFGTFNPHTTLAENLLFGVVAGSRLAGTGLAADPFFKRIIAAEGLEHRLVEIGLRIAENSLEVFAGLPPDHPLLERFSMIKAQELDEFARIAAIARGKQARHKLSSEERQRLMTLALAYVEPRHRLGLIDEQLRRRVLRARASIRHFLPRDYVRDIEFYDPDVAMLAAPIRDNLLFGRVVETVAMAEQKVAAFLRTSLPELGLEDLVYDRALEFDVGPGGRNLFGPQRAAVNIARGMMIRPDILVIEGALHAYTGDEAAAVATRLRHAMRGRTVIATFGSEAKTGEPFDIEIRFDGARGRLTRVQSGEARGSGDGSASNGHDDLLAADAAGKEMS